MNDSEILAALHAGNSESGPALLEAYGDSLFRYCWFLLRGRDASEIAVRDTFVAAIAYADRLPGPESLRPWLYALAHTECHRHHPAPPGAADEPPARPSQPDADNRVVAWNAVTSMPPLASEALELSSRHELPAAGIALVLGVQDAESLLAAAREELRRSLGAHLVVRRTGFDCAGLTAALRGWAGTMTTETRERVLAHAMDCAICGPHLPGGVSVARVFALLPDPRPGTETRDVVLARLTDPRHSGYRDFVARRAAQSAPIAALAAGSVAAVLSAGPVSSAEDSMGSPAAASDGSAEPRRRARMAAGASRSLSRGRLIAGVAAAGVAAMAGAVLALAGFPGTHEITPSGNGTGASSPAAVPPSGINSGPPSRIGAVGAAPIAPHGSASAAPPLLVATFPGKQRDGQALYLSASKQASAASSPGPRVLQRGTPPPVTGLIVPPNSPPPSSSSGQPMPPSTSPTPSPSSADSGSSSPPATHHWHRHGGGSSGSASPTPSDSPAPETSSPSTTGSARS